MRFALLALAAIASFSVPALAHPDDEIEFGRRPVADVARDAVIQLITQAKLPATWARADLVKMDIRTKEDAQQWVVTFENKAERRNTKRLLHVLMTREGEFISANHKLL